MGLPKIIAIVGPTAAGKTRLAVLLAQMFDGELISVDSRQVYRGMDIGTAKALPAELEGVVQWGVDLVDPDREYSAAAFQTYAQEKIQKIVSRKKLPILVGGTGLWFQGVVDNFTFQGEPSREVRSSLSAKSLQELFLHYQALDPEGAKQIDKHSPNRLIRAIETALAGLPFSRRQGRGKPLYRVLSLGVAMDRAVLYDRINARVETMFAHGFLDEVVQLKEQYGCEAPGMTGIGYRQICHVLSQKMDLETAIDLIKRDSRHYAKRQMSWFRRDTRIQWIKTTQDAERLVKGFLS